MLRYLAIAAVFFGHLAFGFPMADDQDDLKSVIPPQVISKPEPKYTEEAKNQHIQGIVVLQMIVDEQGRPTQIQVLSPLGFGLDENAIEAATHWRFRPGTTKGKPVRVLAQIQVTFRLTNEAFNAKTERQRTDFNVALRDVQERKVKEATIKSLSDLARQKYAPGVYLYGKVLEDGLGIAADPEGGFRLIQQSAESKYGPAIYEVAMARLSGDRLDKDPAKALELMHSAAKFGSGAAESYLGGAYENGDGVPMDFAKSRENFRLCASADQAPCQYRRGKSLLEHSDHPDRDYVQAIAWLMLASDHKVDAAEKILQQEDARLTPAQVASATKLKAQLVHHQ